MIRSAETVVFQISARNGCEIAIRILVYAKARRRGRPCAQLQQTYLRWLSGRLRPKLVRGDVGFGNETVIRCCETNGYEWYALVTDLDLDQRAVSQLYRDRRRNALIRIRLWRGGGAKYERADTAYSPRFREEEPSASAEPLFSRRTSGAHRILRRQDRRSSRQM